MLREVTAAGAGYQANEAEIAEVLVWFERYDELVGAKDLQAMADMAMFPINEVTDDGVGNGIAGQCDRMKFLGQMKEVVAGAGETQMTSTRYPIFLGSALVFVVTDAEFSVGEQVHRMRYGDLLIKNKGGWQFQTMVAPGFGEQM